MTPGTALRTITCVSKGQCKLVFHVSAAKGITFNEIVIVVGFSAESNALGLCLQSSQGAQAQRHQNSESQEK